MQHRGFRDHQRPQRGSGGARGSWGLGAGGLGGGGVREGGIFGALTSLGGVFRGVSVEGGSGAASLPLGMGGVRGVAAREAARRSAMQPRSWRTTGGRLAHVLTNLSKYGEVEGVSAAERANRLKAVQAIFFCGVVAVCARLYHVQTKDHQKWLLLAAKQHETSIEIEGARGDVVDAQGRTLVTSVETASVALHPKWIKDKDSLATKLAEITKLPREEVSSRLQEEKSFVWLAKNLPREVGLQVLALKNRAVEVYPEFQRTYPHGDTGALVIGRVSREGRGQSGIELAFDKQLSAPNQMIAVRRDARGRFLSAADPESFFNIEARFNELSQALNTLPRRAPELPVVGGERGAVFRSEGSEVQLSIDIALQDILEDEFNRGLSDAQAKRVFGLMMDADSGEILALGQAPGFPLSSSVKLSTEDLRNSVLQDNFEPGSTFKPLVAALAVNAGLANLDEMIDCQNGLMVVGKHRIRDVHPVGVVSLAEVLVRSSNVGIAKIGARLGRDGLYRSIRELGFGERTGIEIQGEAKGIVRPLGDWKTIDIATASFGQGISVTAPQLVRAYATLINGGLLVEPTLIHGSHPAPKRVLEEGVARAVADAIVGVTESQHGTGKLAAIKGVHVGGKTGTAQKPLRTGRGYDPDHVLASFIGFVDGSHVGINRKIVMFVGVDEPGVKPRWGGALAGPVFRRTMERVLSHMMAGQGIQTARVRRPASPLM